MASCNAGGKDCGGSRLYSHDLHIRVLFFQIFSGTGHGSAGSDTCNKDVHFSVGIFPDFRTGVLIVCLRVGRIDKLSRNKAARCFRSNLFRFRDGTLHALCPFGQHDLSTICLNQFSPFYTHCFRHGDDELVSSCSCNRCKSDSGVSGGRLDECCARLQCAGCLCIVNDGFGDSVFDRACRVEVFQLCIDLCRNLFFCFNMGEFQEWCFSDQLIC